MDADLSDIERRALDLVGMRFAHQGRASGGMVDCLGVVVHAFGEEASAADQRDYFPQPDGDRLLDGLERLFERIDCTADDAPGGSLLTFYIGGRLRKHVRHLAVKVGAAHMIHALDGYGVIRTPIDDRWSERLEGVYRWRASH